MATEERKDIFQATPVSFGEGPTIQVKMNPGSMEEAMRLVNQAEAAVSVNGNPYSNIKFTEKTGEVISPIEDVNPIVQQSPIDKTPPEEKIYLILLALVDGEGEEYSYIFEYVKGRQNVYDRLKIYTETEALDLDKSQVLTSKSIVENAITVLEFFRHMRDNDLIKDDSGFDFEEYAC